MLSIKNYIFPLLTNVNRTKFLPIFLIIIVTVIFPRLMLIGGLPATDEGVFTYFAQMAHQSISLWQGLPDTGQLMLYPVLTHWVFNFDINSIVALRLFDMFVASIATYILFCVLEKEAKNQFGSLSLSLIFFFTMNQEVFIQSGFKNTIFAAYIPLFLAVWLGQNAKAEGSIYRWSMVGSMLALSVLLRETFLPFVVLGSFTILISKGLKPFCFLITGGLCTGISIIGLVLAARGSITSLLESYIDASKIYISISDIRTDVFFDSANIFVKNSLIAIVISIIALTIIILQILSTKERSREVPKFYFWLLASLLPLLEPISKIGFPYHFSVCLPGLAGLSALGWRSFCERYYFANMNNVFIASSTMAIAVLILLVPRMSTLLERWPLSSQVIENIGSKQWPDFLTNHSNYLLATKSIQNIAPSEGTLAISGYMYTLYPLTGLLPPSPDLANLTNTIIKLDLSSEELRKKIMQCPPDVIMTTTRTEWPGGPEILAAVKATGIYEEIVEITKSSNRHYGNFGGTIFRVIKKLPCEDSIN